MSTSVRTMKKNETYFIVVQNELVPEGVEIPVRFVELAIQYCPDNQVKAIKLVLEAYRGKIGLIDAKNVVQFVDMALKLYRN
jgi:ribosomal protein L7/L12